LGKGKTGRGVRARHKGNNSQHVSCANWVGDQFQRKRKEGQNETKRGVGRRAKKKTVGRGKKLPGGGPSFKGGGEDLTGNGLVKTSTVGERRPGERQNTVKGGGRLSVKTQSTKFKKIKYP